MTAEPEYPIVSTDELKPGQQYRYGPSYEWITASPARRPQWVEAKPLKVQPLQAGDRVRYRDDRWSPDDIDLTATVRYAGRSWLIVQVDDGDYEDAWAILHTDRIDPLADQ